MKHLKSIFCVLLAAIICLTLCCCNKETTTLTKDYTRSESIPVYDFYSEETASPESYSEFSNSYSDFAARLLISASEDEGFVLPVLPLYTGLAATMAGAFGKTLSETEALLGVAMNSEKINDCTYYLNSRVKFLNGEEGSVNSASALWINDTFSVKAQFLQAVVNYFDTEVYRTTLSSSETRQSINTYISNNQGTDSSDLASSLSDESVLALVGAFSLEDSWISSVSRSEGVFKGTKGEETATFYTSNEMYIESTDAQGFIKSFENTPCRFVAIMPKEGVNLEEYINSLSGNKLQNLMNSQSGINRCVATYPAFELKTSGNYAEAIDAMGGKLLTSENSALSNLTMSEGLYLSDVLLEAEFALTADPTEIDEETLGESSDIQALNFDSPFIFMIIENETNLPLTIGVVNTLK